MWPGTGVKVKRGQSGGGLKVEIEHTAATAEAFQIQCRGDGKACRQKEKNQQQHSGTKLKKIIIKERRNKNRVSENVASLISAIYPCTTKRVM